MSKAELISSEDIDISMSMNISKKDLISLAVSEYEQKLLQRDEALRKRSLAIDKDIKSKEAQLKSLSEELIKPEVSKADAIVKSFKELGASVSLKTSFDYNAKENEVSGRFSFSKNKEFQHISFEFKIEGTDELVKISEEVKSLSEDKSNISMQRIEIKRALSNVATMERAATAHIVRETLKSSDKGQEILKALDTLNLITPALEQKD